jgi:predicted transcriptional regulator
MFLRGMAEGGYQEVAMRQALANVAVQDVMVEDVVSVPPDLSLQGLLPEYFLRYGYHGFPVVEDGKVLGTIAVEQVRQSAESERSTTTVE